MALYTQNIKPFSEYAVAIKTTNELTRAQSDPDKRATANLIAWELRQKEQARYGGCR